MFPFEQFIIYFSFKHHSHLHHIEYFVPFQAYYNTPITKMQVSKQVFCTKMQPRKFKFCTKKQPRTSDFCTKMQPRTSDFCTKMQPREREYCTKKQVRAVLSSQKCVLIFRFFAARRFYGFQFSQKRSKYIFTFPHAYDIIYNNKLLSNTRASAHRARARRHKRGTSR